MKMPWRITAVPLAALLAVACAGPSRKPYTPGAAQVAGLTASEARKKVADDLQRARPASLCNHVKFGSPPTRTETQVTFSEVRVTCDDGNRYAYRYADTRSPVVTYRPAGLSSIYGVSAVDVTGGRVFWWDDPEAGEEFARAWFVLANPGGGRVDDDAFAETVRAYRAANPKPRLPEEGIKFKAQGEFAVQQKRFEDAAIHFGKALQLAPWWGPGYFNRAQILAELGAYGEAVADMKRYLALEPDAPNARAAQLHIYQWESVTPAR
jgi:tetratricopeptide (TPR) repeat protein